MACKLFHDSVLCKCNIVVMSKIHGSMQYLIDWPSWHIPGEMHEGQYHGCCCQGFLPAKTSVGMVHVCRINMFSSSMMRGLNYLSVHANAKFTCKTITFTYGMDILLMLLHKLFQLMFQHLIFVMVLKFWHKIWGQQHVIYWPSGC